MSRAAAPPAARAVATNDTRGIASRTRIEGTVAALMAVLLLSVTALTFFLVARVFASATPPVDARLEWKALVVAGSGCLAALLLGVLFVHYRVGPLLRATEEALHALEQTTRDALESNRLKGEFLAHMSHELRTPMNGVVGMTELLLSTRLDEKQSRFAEAVRTSAHSLLTILNEILDLSKIEAGKMEVHEDDLGLRQLVEEVGGLLSERAHAKGLELALHVRQDVPEALVGDALRVRQVLTNLVGNAVKFTDRGEVVVRLQRVSTSGARVVVRFEVIDTGIGISKGDRPRLFEAFTQVDGSMTRRQGGTGLGLTISRRLVERMGGELGVESEPGKGSRFFFELPFEVPAERQSAPMSIAPSALAMRVLVVGDNATNRLILEEILDAWGMAYVSVESAPRALDEMEKGRVEGRPFTLAVLDMQLGAATGLDLARRTRSDERYAKTRLVMLTTLSRSTAPTEAAARWVDAVLVKPVRQADLLAAVSRVTGASSRRTLAARPSGARSSGAMVAAADGRSRVLVVEDDPINQEVMVEMLAKVGFDADVAGDGRAALAELEKRSYPLVFMDCQMPVMDGYAATRELRRREAAAGGNLHTVVVAVTAHALVGEREKTEAAGMEDFITKPLSKQALFDVLARWIVPEGEGDAPPASGEVLVEPSEVHTPRIVALFQKHGRADLDEIAGAMKAGDGARVAAVAHRLGGGCRSVGATPMAAVCRAIETQARGGDLELTELYSTLDALYPATVARLEALVAAAAASERAE